MDKDKQSTRMLTIKVKDIRSGGKYENSKG